MDEGRDNTTRKVKQLGYADEQIQYYLEQASRLEEENNAIEAIRNLKEAISLIELNNDLHKALDLYIKIGDLYQINSDIDEGLRYYNLAYELSIKLQSKISQVDILVRITNSFVNKGQVSQGVGYAELAQKILGELDYVEGKINIRISLARLYYVQKDYFRAREICNEALRLCDEGHPLYKGTTLNLLAELYKDMTSVEEHLQILNQAYECFEKANYLRGKIGVLNNFAVIYSDKLQDYSKTLECLMKVKELSENSIYKEFIGISYMNIGEIYYRLLRYEEAEKWLLEALKKPHGPYADNAILYCLIFLIQTCIKLHKYDETNDYFIQANEQLKRYEYRESTLVSYYKAVAFMFNELEDTNMAKHYIKKALSIVQKDTSMIKWEIGLLYEQIKLKETEKISDINEILEAVRYILSNYKNNDVILDAVYDTCIELIKKGNNDIALEFMNSYKELNSGNPIVNIKLQNVKSSLYIY